MNRRINETTNKQIYNFLNNSSDAGVLTTTTKSYLSILQEFERFLIAHLSLNEEEIINYDFINLTLDDIKAYSDYICNHTTNKISTHNQKLGVIRLFAQYILNNYNGDINLETLNSFNNMVKNIYHLELKDEDKKHYYFTKNDIIKLHSTILHGDFKKKELLLAIFLLYRDTATKREGVRLLNVSDIHFGEDSYVEIKNNTKGKVDKYYLRPDTVKALKDYLLIRNPKKPDDDALFISNKGGRINSTTIYRLMKDIYVEAGFGHRDKYGNPVTPYDITSIRSGVLIETAKSVGAFDIDTHFNRDLDYLINNGNKLIRDSVFNYSIDYSTERRLN